MLTSGARGRGSSRRGFNTVEGEKKAIEHCCCGKAAVAIDFVPISRGINKSKESRSSVVGGKSVLGKNGPPFAEGAARSFVIYWRWKDDMCFFCVVVVERIVVESGRFVMETEE